MEFIVVNETVINAGRVLAIAHHADTLNLKPHTTPRQKSRPKVKHLYELRDKRWTPFPDVAENRVSILFTIKKAKPDATMRRLCL